MTSETIVAVFETAADAEKAISALEAGGVSADAIRHYAQGDVSPTGETTTTTHHGRGFWAWLLGEEGPETTTDTALYDRSLQSGGTVVTVIVRPEEAERAMDILEAHSPVDLEQRAADYGMASGRMTGSDVAGSGMAGGGMTTAAQGGPGIGTSHLELAGRGVTGTGPTDFSTPDAMYTDKVAPTTRTGTTATAGTTETEQVIPLAEEQVQIGKRAVERGTTRLRRYVVERPVEEQITLRNESVSIARRPATGTTSTVPEDAFTEKTIEVRETTEEAVVAKTAQVREEVVVSKQVGERVETVRDTVRREEIDVEGPAGQAVEVSKDAADRPRSP